MEQHSGDVVVVVVPIPAQGHLNQLLHLTRLIASRGLPAYFIGTATHNRQAKDRVHGWDPSTISNIHFQDFQIPEYITPPPEPNLSNKFPNHLVPTFEASLNLREPLGVLLRALSTTYRRVVIVHDSTMSFAAEEASFLSNAEAYCFNPCAAFSMHYYIWEVVSQTADEEESLLPLGIPRLSFEDSTTEEMSVFLARNKAWRSFSTGDLYNTCDALEGRFINLIAQRQLDKKLWAIGPLNPIAFDSTRAPPHKCLEWLDKQPPNSVIYVSFGTMTSLSDDQIAELAIGLERSEQKFIWVLRYADIGDIYKEKEGKAPLPDGFEERVEGVGMIVRDWAPQPHILAHSSTGGFMSHCGWNSCMESLSMGVPIAAWSMHSDQPRNMLLITEVLKVGLVVCEWAQRKELVSSDTIESSIRKLMVSEEGNMMRKKARELGVAVRQSVSEGGSSTTQLESFITHISR
ncbi:hypothetical protein IFM89_006929 [Coptis chinensis]|uniref:Glycosyltransferase N-terminal domain-containing protein n=1 Tax=Coptis chinensis TaxID=261450 RepID=A0A835LKN2_9MAGN|nr:hypothetical protein IFM89_006929 [Coptis chinensis]